MNKGIKNTAFQKKKDKTNVMFQEESYEYFLKNIN